MKNANFVEQLRNAVLEFSAYEDDHCVRREALKKRYAETEGSRHYSTILEKHDTELAEARNAATEKLASITSDFEKLLTRGYQVDGSFLHRDREILTLLNKNELLLMGKKHCGNTTMERIISAEAEKRGMSIAPMPAKEHRLEGFGFLSKMARAAIADRTSPTRGSFTDENAWNSAFSTHKQASDTSDLETHFDRYDTAHLLKIPPQFAAE